VELNQLSGKVNQLEQYIFEKDCEGDNMIEAHEDSLVAHLESCEEEEKNKDEAEKYSYNGIILASSWRDNTL